MATIYESRHAIDWAVNCLEGRSCDRFLVKVSDHSSFWFQSSQLLHADVAEQIAGIRDSFRLQPIDFEEDFPKLMREAAALHAAGKYQPFTDSLYGHALTRQRNASALRVLGNEMVQRYPKPPDSYVFLGFAAVLEIGKLPEKPAAMVEEAIRQTTHALQLGLPNTRNSFELLRDGTLRYAIEEGNSAKHLEQIQQRLLGASSQTLWMTDPKSND